MSSKSGTTKPRASKPAAKKTGASTSRPKPSSRPARARVPKLSGPVIIGLIAGAMVLGLVASRGGNLLPAGWRRPATVHPGGKVIGAEPAPQGSRPEPQPDAGQPAAKPEAKVDAAKPAGQPNKPSAKSAAEDAPTRVAGVLTPQERHARLAEVVTPAGFTTEWAGGAAVLRESANEIAQGRGSGHRVALTFDAHYDSQPVDKLLALLAERGLHATFFLTGAYARATPESVKKIAAAGHEIGNHSDTHRAFTKLSDAACIAELERAEQAILPLAGAAYRPYWRPPLGDRNLRVLRLALRHGFLPIYWTVDTLDWQENATPDSVMERLTARGLMSGSIVLQHVGSAASVGCLPREIEQVRARELVPGTLSELLK